jgi:N-acetylglucosaminyldiphosphoundecaprenol N-acetyl-beta-D-mannosaminyltransferase
VLDPASDGDTLARVDVLGVHVTPSTFANAVETFTAWIESGRREYVTFTGVHGVMESQRDPELLKIHNGAGFVSCDGMPLVWSCRRVQFRDAERVYGPDAMLAMCEVAAQRGYRVFLYGGKDGVPERLRDRLCARIPGLQIVGVHSPPFRDLTEQEMHNEIEMINAAGADLVWVGLSTPKQERWMATRRPLLDAAVLFGVGAAFDFHAGLVRQAPPVMQQAGLEWLFRLAMEPRRLWRRYLRNNPAFIWKVARTRPTLVAP